jgi:hypothetical protein
MRLLPLEAGHCANAAGLQQDGGSSRETARSAPVSGIRDHLSAHQEQEQDYGLQGRPSTRKMEMFLHYEKKIYIYISLIYITFPK